MFTPCPKPTRDTPQREYREKARTVCSKIVRLNGVCEKCGRTEKKDNVVLHAAHIIPARFGYTDCDIDNRICLCALCHTATNDSAHLNEKEFHLWFDGMFPGRRERLQKMSRYICKWDWSDVYEKLLEKYKSLLEEKAQKEK